MNQNPNLAEVLEQQSKALDQFINTTSKSLAVNDALTYLEYWEQKTTQSLVPFLSPEQIQKIKSVWLEQRFELTGEQQLAALVKKFREVMDELIGVSPQ